MSRVLKDLVRAKRIERKGVGRSSWYVLAVDARPPISVGPNDTDEENTPSPEPKATRAPQVAREGRVLDHRRVCGPEAWPIRNKVCALLAQDATAMAPAGLCIGGDQSH